jgi:4-hydroxythreonine-4-phosphate dehydrogenase
MPGRIAISLGDVTGIGPEVTLKALAAEWEADDFRYLLFGDAKLLHDLNSGLGLGLPLPGPRLEIENPLKAPLPANLPAGAAQAASAALAWLRAAARCCLDRQADALVTAPLSKEAVLRSGEKFVGQTEFLSEIAATPRTSMMLLGSDESGRWLRVALATTHVPIKDVAAQLTREKVEHAIALSAAACQDLGLRRARIGVCGLNPHAGEGGQLGGEELSMIGPAVRAAQKQGLDVHGPFAADTLFHYAYRGDYDAVVAMYHDQGLAPLKMIAFENGVNWTLGLPFIRTSPDHGTAYDIAGKGVADPRSMIAALGLAKMLLKRKGTD